MNGDILKELLELEKDAEMPAKVSNRLVLAGMIQMVRKLEGVMKYDGRIRTNSRLLKVSLSLNILVIAALIASI